MNLAEILSRENRFDLATNAKIVKKYNIADYLGDSDSLDLAEQLQDAYRAELKLRLGWHEANVLAKKLMSKIPLGESRDEEMKLEKSIDILIDAGLLSESDLRPEHREARRAKFA